MHDDVSLMWEVRSIKFLCKSPDQRFVHASPFLLLCSMRFVTVYCVQVLRVAVIKAKFESFAGHVNPDL